MRFFHTAADTQASTKPALRSAFLTTFAFLTAIFLLALAQPAEAGTKVNTVTIFGGQQSGDGTNGGNTNTDYQIPGGSSDISWRLEESNVDIVSAYMIYDITYHSFTAYTGNHMGWRFGFDACSGTCDPDPISGSGIIVDSGTSSQVFSYEGTESIRERRVVRVTNESELASYTGGGTTLHFQSSYQVGHASTVNSISNIYGKLVVTYEYDDTSAEFTNTVIYPIDSTAGSDSGTRTAVQAKNCTKNSNCPLFSWNVEIPEFSAPRVQAFAELSALNDGNNTNDISHTVNIQGIDNDTPTQVHEAALAGGQGNTFEFRVNPAAGGVGFAENTAQTGEWYHDSAASTADIYLMSGEIYDTYAASASAGTKTKTIRIPGEHQTDLSTGSGVSVPVYFPETGVDVKSAWWRVSTTYSNASAETLAISTKVGNNATSGSTTYNLDGPATVVNPMVKLNHIIPSSDYTELEAATSTSSKLVRLNVTPSNNGDNFGGLMGELMITYTYTGSTEYQNSISLFGFQTGPPLDSSASATTPDGAPFPETGAHNTDLNRIFTTFMFSDSDTVAPSGQILVDASLASSSPSCSPDFVSFIKGANAYTEHWDNLIIDAIDDTDGATYSQCIQHNDGGDTSVFSAMNSEVLYTYQFYPAPNTPTVSGENQDRNPDLTSSAFSGQHSHTHSDWLVMESSATTCDDTSSLVVWRKLDDATNKTLITVNTTNGTFLNALSGQTQLAAGTNYKACVRHNNGGDFGDPDSDSNWSTPTAFTTNTPPTASSVLLQSGNAVFTPNAGTTKTITGTATVTDVDGCSTLASPVAKFYRSGAGISGSDDANIRYTMSCSQDGGSCTGGADTTATYTCTASIQYYADPTDSVSPQPTENWVMNLTPFDTIGSGTAATDTIEMNSLVAASATSAISYGALNLGANTGSTNQNVVVQNQGNVRLDLNLSAYSGSFGDGLSMSCSTGTVPVGNEKYFKTPFTYASGGTAFTSANVEEDADLLKSTGSPSTMTIYTGFGLPSSGVDGSCSGVVSVSPVHDTTND
jgi:hypothetical protein